MPENKDKVKKLYDTFVSEGYEMESEENFRKNLSYTNKRKAAYDALVKDGYEMEPFEEFENNIGFGKSTLVRTQQVTPNINAIGQTGPRQTAQAVQPTTKKQPQTVDGEDGYNLPTVEEMMDGRSGVFTPIFESETLMDDKGNTLARPVLTPAFDPEEGGVTAPPVYRDVLFGGEYDPAKSETKEYVKRNTVMSTVDYPKQNREQVALLSLTIDRQLEDAYKRAQDEHSDAKPIFVQQMLHDLADGSNTGLKQTDDAYQTLVKNDTDVRALHAAKNSLKNARQMIDEADKSVKEGDYGFFNKGIARGFGNKFFDARTWDMGLSDAQDNGATLTALAIADKGGELTPAQQTLLDAKAVELATNAYFSSSLGRGYKAGGVTAESIPFMIEMCINPASGAGSSAQSMLTRYALRRFGKEVVKKNAKKYVAGKIATRVTGDVVGSAVMSATTGAVRTMADAEERASGQVLSDSDENGNSFFAGHTEGDGMGVALSKAFVNTTIENHSEMVGEYFAPVLKPVFNATGKGVRKGLEKIGADKVSKFIDDVSASDVAKLVTDFEKHSKWNGTIGEYAEEVVGGIENALLVGDQTLDADKNTGVFNIDNNIDTFLGVALMGGFISGIKTLGYRTPKYRAKKDMTKKADEAATLFGNQEIWGDIRNTLAFGNEEDVKSRLGEVLNNQNYNEEQKRAVLDYAKSVEIYKGMLKGEGKRRTEGDEDPVQVDAETSFDNGYSLEDSQEMNDAKSMLDFQRQQMRDAFGILDGEEDIILGNNPVETITGMRETHSDEQIQKAIDYLNAKATYDGMIQNVQDNIESRINASDLMIDSHSNKADGMIHPATMKLNDRKVYIVGGNVVMNEDGTGIDHGKSDESIVLRDAETGNIEFADPTSILQLDEPIDAAQEKEIAQEQIRQQYAQEAANKIDGVLPFNDRDEYTILGDGGETKVTVYNSYVDVKGEVLPVPDGMIIMSYDGGKTGTLVSKESIQQAVDACNLMRLQQFEQEKALAKVEEKQQEAESSRPEYNINDELILRDAEGNLIKGSVVSSENEDGLIEVYTENPINGKMVNMFTRDELDILANTDSSVQETSILGTNSADINSNLEENVPQQPELEPMPMIGEGEDAEPDYTKVSPQRSHKYIYEESGLPKQVANDLVKNNIESVRKEQEKLKKSEPKMGTSIAKYRKELAEWQKKASDAQGRADYWNAVKAEQDKIVALENAEREAANAAARDKAIIEEQKRQEDVLRKKAEQEQIGINNVAPSIREKWNAAPKIDGTKNEIVLPNGEKITGHYVLTESGAASPSHNANAEFIKTDGFPVDANGQSVNDRDYERDMDAQQITRGIAGNYDSRAMQTPVVVSNDGIVLSGNGRTMAGELAASQNTDNAYVEHLKKYGKQYGFTEEQVAGMQHPRVLFVPDEDMPYTADTFAKFNQQDMKGQSKTEHAVKMGKIVDDTTYNKIVRTMNQYDTLGDFYADTQAAVGAIKELASAGVISSAQMSEMFDGENVSSHGKELLENMLIGKAFESNPDVVRMITEYPAMRQAIITALSEISNNKLLGEDYSIESELSQAIELVYNARKGGIKNGELVSAYARQGNLFEFDDGATVADYTNVTMMMLADTLNDTRITRLKKILSIYNNEAKDNAMGQMDMFAGGIESREDILKDVLKLINYGTEEEQQAAINKSVEQRKAESIQQNGIDGYGNDEGTETTEAQKIAESIAKAEQDTDTNPTEAQKEAGNYKKGHLKLDGYDITIENPKGSIRSGVDRNGQKWSIEMNNTYGYIRGTEGIDGDHIDVFLSDKPTEGYVYVIDQVNEDGTFDEHKVMYGFNSALSAKRAYLSNYAKGWKGLGNITMVSKDEFKKWIDSSHRKTKPFAEYKSVKAAESNLKNGVSAKEENKEEGKSNLSGNRLVTDERYAELRERMRKKLLGQMNIGIDPEILSIGTEMAVYHLEKGARKFTEYAKAMIADLGDTIRPYLKSFYNGARDLPEVTENGLNKDMTPYDEVQTFDVANFDKPGIDAMATAETVKRETEVEQEVEIAQERIKKTRTERKKNEKKAVTSQKSNEQGLFDGFDNEKIEGNELQRIDEPRSRGLSANGNRHKQGLSRGAETGSESGQQNSRGTDNGRERTGDAVDRAVRPRLSDTITEKKNTHNNHSERGEDHAPTSVNARIDANIKAIELAQQLIESGETATPKQMVVLRKFSGWGGLGKAFSDNAYSAQIQQLLGIEAYQEAVMSANSAYYTPSYVVDTLWDIVTQMGFKGGNILEGSAGIGNILGQMPISISERSDIHAVEIDRTSGSILSLLYPDAKVEIQGFEQTHISNGSVDLAITNVPFVTGLRVNDTTGDKDLSKKFHNIHDFCIAKNVRKLRESGIGIFITSNGTLDNSKKLRDWIVSEGGADFIGAFRMNNKTFGGTGVTSDIIVIRKRVNGRKSDNAIDVSTITGERMAEFDTGETRKVKGQEVPIVRQLAMDYNRYFIEHPENMAGVMLFAFEQGDTFRPTSKGLYPAKDKNQEQMLAKFVDTFKEENDEFVALNESRKTDREYVADTSVDGKKLGELYVKDGKLVVSGAGGYYPLALNGNKVKGHTKVECFNAYASIKKALADVLAYQTENESNEGLKPLLAKLNKAYDDFVATYGHFNKNTAIAFLRKDVDYPNVFSLEKFEETGDKSGKCVQKFGKTDVFNQRVVEKEKEPTPTNVKDGIIASVFKFGRIDVPYIAKQLSKSIDEIKNEIITSGYGFEDPATRQMELSYQYLSGNVREKLRQAQDNNENGEYDGNIKALQEVVPMDIPAHLIDFTLGSSWIAPKLYEDYVSERTGIEVKFTAAGGTWFMDAPNYDVNKEKNRSMGVYSELFKQTIYGHTLIESAIQNRTITVSHTYKNNDGSTETVTDKEATQACSAKIDEIRQDFKEWARQRMQSDSEMSAVMERVYNDTFNNYVPMNIPGDFVPKYFGGASHKFNMRPHQGKAIVRGTMQPLLLAHEVGTGKTFTLISIAMEMRRLGTARKPMIVVQNATVGQFVSSAKELYPNAKILTLEEADRSAEGRKNFYAKIRYNDWDMIVVPQSTFEFIPDSEERQMTFVQDKIEEKMLVLEKMQEADPDGNSFITRQAEKEIADLETQLAGLSDVASKKRTANNEKKRAITMQNAEVKAMEMLDRRTDDVENFDDMGIDALLIDEAHEYKHLGFATAMQRGVKGVDPSYSKKAQGVFLKTQAVLEKNNGRNVIFATGTPISNTAAEIWTFMRYLIPADTMKEYSIYYFDDFVRNFGNIQQMLEFTTSGKFKENNRFAGYVNLPELVRIWSGVADTVLTRDAGGVSDKIPDIEEGKAQDIYLPQTKALRSVMKYVKSELDRFEKMSGKEKKRNSYIPLTMYGIAKAAAVDARLVLSDAEDDPNSKTNEAVRQTIRSLEETKDYKGTVAIFADNYQNKESGFNLYEDIRRKLIDQGVPSDQIVVMRSGMTVKKKLEIFDKVNSGDVRVVMGSTFTLGTGVNIQERLHTLIHVDAPNRPMDYTQRNGRILRQGNLHKQWDKPVRVLRFGVEDSLDVTAYQRLKTKGAIADSIMNGKQMMQNSMENRALEEDEDIFGDTVAQLSGSEYAMLKNQAEKDARKFESKLKQWEADQTYIHNQKPRLTEYIKASEQIIESNEVNLKTVSTAQGDTSIKVAKKTYANVESMSDYIKDFNKKLKETEDQIRQNPINEEQERKLSLNIGGIDFEVKTRMSKVAERKGGTFVTVVKRVMTYSCDALNLKDVPVKQMLLRNAIDDIMTNVITGNDFRERIESARRSIERNKKDLEQISERDGKPFQFEEELKTARERVNEYSALMKKEMKAKEAKYAEMDANVATAETLVATNEDEEENKEDDNRYRDGNGELSNEELSVENDPLAKILGKSSRRANERIEFAKRERERMTGKVNVLAKKLGVEVEVLQSADDLVGKKRRAKGFFNKNTGKITVIVGNHSSVEDVEKTVLHEAVAHYGLRALFGEHFNDFLNNVFRNAEEGIRKQITAMAAKNGWDFRTATEEYLAGLAENTNFERAFYSNWFGEVKRYFLKMLRQLGFELNDVTLTDNELRYVLWRSYENLAEPGRYRSILGEAADVAMQNALKVGNYEEKEQRSDMVADSFEDGLLFRDDTDPINRVFVRRDYEKEIASNLYQFQEAMQDSMLGLKTLMDKIEKATGRKAADFENAYVAENAMSSKNQAEADVYKNLLMKPLLSTIATLESKGASQADITDYMMAKHGLERNEVMANHDAQTAFDEYQKNTSNGKKSLQDFINECRKRDYSGLTALTETDDVTTAETVAQQMVDDFEDSYLTDTLWDRINACTKATLSKLYESGIISKDVYEKTRDMYEYYIPLRGWDEKTSDEVYGYLTDKSGPMNGSIMKKAEGRTSKADDPIATIAAMAESGISQGNRNLMKQRFLNFVLNNPSDAVSVNNLWLRHDDTNDSWEPVFADLNENDTADEVERKVRDFEDKMEQLAEQDPENYKHGRDAVGIPYIVKNQNMREHQVMVKRNGMTYVLTINGSPRAAQALNGLSNPNVEMQGTIGNILKAGEYVNRQMSAFYTTRNPNFVASNFIRDALYANSMVWVKEQPNYAIRYHKNFGKVNPVRLKMLLAKHTKGTLDMNDPEEKMFYQFMMNGGETGYTVQRDIEKHKKAIKKEVAIMGDKIPVREALRILGEQFDDWNRAVENCARFAAFMTSRQMGRSIDRSIYDAKEISVNFNKKGSGSKFLGAKEQTKIGNLSAFVSGGGRIGYVFWNAAIQGTYNTGKAIKQHPRKGLAMLAATFLLGALIPALAGDGDGDDDKNYYNLPDFVRRSNICFRIGDKWITIPMSVEMRAMYGLGELATSVMSGNEKLSGEEIAKKIAEQMSQMLPLDLMEGNGGLSALTPSSVKPAWEAYINKDWTGLPLYKDTEFNKNMPEWTKAYNRTSSLMVKLSELSNRVSGGDKYTKGWADWNPAIVEHLLEGVFGGVTTTINQMVKTVETATGEREFDWRNIPIASRVVKNADERTQMRNVNEKYFKYVDEFNKTKQRMTGYEREVDSGAMEYAEKIDFLNNSPEFRRYEIMEDYISDINSLNTDIKEAESDEERKSYQDEQNALKKKMIEAIKQSDDVVNR